jgi:hypothetical protein
MDPKDEHENPNPIVAMAMRIRARKDVAGAIDSATPAAAPPSGADAAAALEAFGQALAVGARRLNSILGSAARRDTSPRITFVRLEKPLRLRLRFGEKRVALDLDEGRQLVLVRGLNLDGEYQFDASSGSQGLINLSILSTEAGYGEALTPNALLKTIAQDAELPRPSHLDGLGPIQL